MAISRAALASALGLACSTCGDPDAPPVEDTSSPGAPIAVPNDLVIAPGSVAGVAAGDTLADFRTAMGEKPLEFIPSYRGDLSALCLLEAEDRAVCAITWAAEQEQPAAEIELLQVFSPRFTTEAGIGPGDPIDEAIAAYGPALFSFSKENENREYVEFDRGPEAVSFRPVRATGADGFAGVYDDMDRIAPTTQSYHADARIEIIEVVRPIAP
ncbi:MAG: hypothetical protein AAFQ67_07740 [Pseudomonadota bacterium]